jgi:hypothetical protein
MSERFNWPAERLRLIQGALHVPGVILPELTNMARRHLEACASLPPAERPEGQS